MLFMRYMFHKCGQLDVGKFTGQPQAPFCSLLFYIRANAAHRFDSLNEDSVRTELDSFEVYHLQRSPTHSSASDRSPTEIVFGFTLPSNCNWEVT